jgi:X-X-X-Leu-X-X-Gly heptad repeat protein
VCSGNPAKLRAVFSNGTGTVDGGVGELSSGVDKLTSAITANTTYTLTVTGSEGQKVTKSVDVTALPSGKFTPTGAPSAVYGNPVLLPNGRVLVGSCKMEVYDLATGSFSVVGNMAPCNEPQTITGLGDGSVLLAGFYSAPATGAALFDPNTGTFTQAASLSIYRDGPRTIYLPTTNRVLVVGGEWGGAIGVRDTAELFDPKQGDHGAFSLLTMNAGRAGNSMTLLADGRVLIAGGYTFSGPGIMSAEVYDPLSGDHGAFTLTQPMAGPRSTHAATLLPSGDVLLTGGLESPKSAELFTPSTGKFRTLADPLKYARYRHSMITLQNGRPLICGGYDPVTGTPVTAVEIYLPATESFTLHPEELDVQGGAVLLTNGSVLIVGKTTKGEPGARLFCP